MMLSDSVLLILLVLLAALLALIPVLIVRMRRAARKQPPAPPPVAEEAAKIVHPRPRMQFPPEEREGQTGGALMQDYSALQSEYRPVDAQKDAPPAPRKNGKH